MSSCQRIREGATPRSVRSFIESNQPYLLKLQSLHLLADSKRFFIPLWALTFIKVWVYSSHLSTWPSEPQTAHLWVQNPWNNFYSEMDNPSLKWQCKWWYDGKFPLGTCIMSCYKKHNGCNKSLKHHLSLLTFADLRKYQRGLLGVIFSCGGSVHFHPGGRDAEIEHRWIDKSGQLGGNSDKWADKCCLCKIMIAVRGP